jgi:hypothetical protein
MSSLYALFSPTSYNSHILYNNLYFYKEITSINLIVMEWLNIYTTCILEIVESSTLYFTITMATYFSYNLFSPYLRVLFLFTSHIAEVFF